MRVYRTIDELRSWRAESGESLGLVPTMGALHSGHLSLIRQARAENERVAVSIFVNPTQFGASDEYASYPRTLDGDLSLLEDEAVDAVFVPDASEMYPSTPLTHIHVSGLSERAEGASRPGHFDGVCLVVCKLFSIVQPQRAYFGRKDAQQLMVVRKMVDDLNIPVEIVPAETVRDVDGLAISSRNVHLSDRERAAARRIPEGLFAAQECYQQGERSAERLREIVQRHIASETLLDIDYVIVANETDLEELKMVDPPALLLVAVRCGNVRLIDNVVLE
jgi:pantoate--beta-alanine ligase